MIYALLAINSNEESLTMTVYLYPEYRLTWHVSPLDENPEVIEFDFWDELQDWVQHMESTCDAFDLDLCKIERI